MRIAIIDDENDARFILKDKLQKTTLNITALYEADGVLSGFQLLQEKTVDLIFLDIKMHDGTGFDLLRQLALDIPVIFVTAYDEFAIQAIKHAAFDYLLKPLKQQLLNEAIEKFKAKFVNHPPVKEALMSGLKSRDITNLIIGNVSGFEIYPVSEILYFESNNQYTIVNLLAKEIVASKGLAHYNKILEGTQFMRVHNRYIINLKKVTRYEKGDGGFAHLSNGKSIPISRKHKLAFLNYFNF